MNDQVILEKLIEKKAEELEEEAIIYFSNDGKAIRTKDVQKLSLFDKDIKKIPSTIGCLTGLQYLDISLPRITTLPESIGELANLRNLTVNCNRLSSLPESIGKLTSLQILSVSNAQLTTLPESIGNLISLEELSVSITKLKTLPESIGKLTTLQSLDVSRTPLTTLPESIENLSCLQKLNVSDTKLTTLPKSIGNLSNLQEMDVNNTPLTTLPEHIGNLSRLQNLYVRNTQLTTLPDSIGDLTSLRNLDVSNTQLTTLPQSIGNLTSLLNLYVIETKLTTLPESIENLTSLKELNVSRTALATLPESIGNLTNLRSLNVRNSQLTMLPESIGNLARLRKLYVSETPLTTLPESVGSLTSLQELYASKTQLTTLPESIGNLAILKKLYVSNTPLTTLPESIGSLTGLQELFASRTQLTTLPESIGNLNSLQELYISRTPLTALPKSMGNLRNLKKLGISKTQISSINTELWKNHSIQVVFLEDISLDRIPSELIDLNLEFIPRKAREDGNDWTYGKGIFIQNLSLSKQPISLFYQKRELIEQYFCEEMVSVNSAKIIFLGDGEVGKTYTLKRLLNGGKKETADNPYNTQTTHGVLIKPYHVNDSGEQYDIKLWDFGGQQIMHSMHRCFLTERSCYVVMLSTRTDRDLLGQARYWLRTVNSFAPNASVIVVVNQWTKNLIKVDEYRLREEFKNIKEFLYFSVVEAEDEQFLTLRESIMEQVRQLDCYGMEFPRSWYGLMTDLENESRNYIPKSEYYRMCFERGLRYEDRGEEGIYDWLLDWFNDLGVCFSYNKNSNSQRLGNYELLNPQWLTRAAYVLINNGESSADNGILTKKQIKAVLTNTEPLDFDDLGRVSYEPNEIEYVLEILRKFRISYQLPDGRELIPVLCNENSSGSARPDWFIPGEMQHTSYEFQYEYLPDTIIHRLMIFCYQSHYEVRDRWRKGMKVDFSSDNPGLTAVIDSGNENQSITIDIYSDGHIPCWEFLSKLREEILLINAELGIKASDYINMETDGVKNRYSVEDTLEYRSDGWTRLPAKNKKGGYEIGEILGSAYGDFNTAIIEKVTENGVISSDRFNQILTAISKIISALEKLDDRSKNSQIVQYLLKDQMTDGFAKVLQSQDEMTALLNTMNKEPLKIKQLGKRILSGAAVTADIVTLVEVSNPGLTMSVCESVADTILMILQSFG